MYNIIKLAYLKYVKILYSGRGIFLMNVSQILFLLIIKKDLSPN